MATPGGDHKRLVLPEKKVWHQVIPRNSNTELEMVKKMLLLDMNTIPNDIVVEILLRLPAKSLLRLRWTSKYWFHLITRDHHDFIMKQFHSSTTSSVLSINYGIADRNKFFQCNLSYNYPNTIGVYVSNKVSISDLPFDYPPGYNPEILGSCNGLILLYECLDCKLCIWNPCTKEYKVLPDPLNIHGVPDNGYSNRVLYNYGFGYDHTTDDYKVLRNGYGHGYLHSDVQVYTLGRNSWRRIEPNPYTHYQLTQGVFFNGAPYDAKQLTQGVFFNGALYWMDASQHNIISFDFGTEKFQYVKTPNLSYVRWGNVKIHVFEGSLCVVLTIRIQQNYYLTEMWIMKDYAVTNNGSLWTKLSTIVFQGQCLLDPLRYTRNGEILLLKNRSYLVLYDPKNGDVKTLCRIFQDSTHFVEEVYTESLVSLNSGTYTGQEPSKEQQEEEKEEE